MESRHRSPRPKSSSACLALACLPAMAQSGPHGHQVDATASEDGHNAPPTPVAFSLMTSAGSGGSSAGNMGKNMIPDLNMEDRDSAGGSKDKPRSEAEVEEAAANADADDDKGKSVAASDDEDDEEPKDNISLEREKRKRMKDQLMKLLDMMPHVPRKSDKVTIVGEAIQHIKALEAKAAILARQAAAAVRGEASSASVFPFRAVPQAAQGMPAMYPSGALRGWGGVPVPVLYSSGAPRGRGRGRGRGWGGVPVPPAAPVPAVPAPPTRSFRTWSSPNVVLTVTNENAYISVCAPRRANTLTMVLSVLENHRIEVITAHVSSDAFRAMFIIFAYVRASINGGNRPSEQVYQMAVSELMFRLHSNNY